VRCARAAVLLCLHREHPLRARASHSGSLAAVCARLSLLCVVTFGPHPRLRRVGLLKTASSPRLPMPSYRQRRRGSRSRSRSPPRRRHRESRSASRRPSPPPRRRSPSRRRADSRHCSPRRPSRPRSPEPPTRSAPKPEPVVPSGVGRALVVEGTPLNSGDRTWQAEVRVARQGGEGINHSGNVRTICFRGPSRASHDQAESDARELERAMVDGPKACRAVADRLQKTKKGRDQNF